MNEISNYLISNSIFYSYINNGSVMAFLIPVLTESQGNDVINIAEQQGLTLSVRNGLLIHEPEAEQKPLIKTTKKNEKQRRK